MEDLQHIRDIVDEKFPKEAISLFKEIYEHLKKMPPEALQAVDYMMCHTSAIMHSVSKVHNMPPERINNSPEAKQDYLQSISLLIDGLFWAVVRIKNES